MLLDAQLPRDAAPLVARAAPALLLPLQLLEALHGLAQVALGLQELLHPDKHPGAARGRPAAERAGGVVNVAVERDGLDADLPRECDLLRGLGVVADERPGEDEEHRVRDFLRVADERERKPRLSAGNALGSFDFLELP